MFKGGFPSGFEVISTGQRKKSMDCFLEDKIIQANELGSHVEAVRLHELDEDIVCMLLLPTNFRMIVDVKTQFSELFAVFFNACFNAGKYKNELHLPRDER